MGSYLQAKRSSVQRSRNSAGKTSHGIAPRKSLGQNFLKDANIIRKIISTLDVQPGDTVLEIGPGEGVMTEHLLQQPLNALYAVDLDERVMAHLSKRYSNVSHLHLIHSDILKIHAGDLIKNNLLATNPPATSSIVIVGNIPYYITSDILLWIFQTWCNLFEAQQADNTSPVLKQVVLMMQKEVAARLIAKPRTKEYGVLSLAASFVATPTVHFHVPPTCFFPQPNVVSSVVGFRFYNTPEALWSFRHVQPMVRLAFQQRRKQLHNGLAGVLRQSRLFTAQEIINRAEDKGQNWFRQRPEELTTQHFIQLYQFLADCGCFEQRSSEAKNIASA